MKWVILPTDIVMAILLAVIILYTLWVKRDKTPPCRGWQRCLLPSNALGARICGERSLGRCRARAKL